MALWGPKLEVCAEVSLVYIPIAFHSFALGFDKNKSKFSSYLNMHLFSRMCVCFSFAGNMLLTDNFPTLSACPEQLTKCRIGFGPPNKVHREHEFTHVKTENYKDRLWSSVQFHQSLSPFFL